MPNYRKPMSLDEMLNAPIKAAHETQPLPRDAVTDEDEIKDVIDECNLREHGASRFVQSVEEFWHEKGFVTKAQFDKLCQIAGR